MGKMVQSTVAKEGGALYEVTPRRAEALFFRLFGAAFIVLGLLLALAFPPFGLFLCAFGVALCFFAPSRMKPKRKFVSFVDHPCAGSPTFGKWNAAVHKGQSQIDRFERSGHQDVQILEWIPETGFARLKGSSGDVYLTSLDQCACPDFEKRGRPCKHIYFLARQMGYSSEDFYSNN